MRSASLGIDIHIAFDIHSNPNAFIPRKNWISLDLLLYYFNWFVHSYSKPSHTNIGLGSLNKG